MLSVARALIGQPKLLLLDEPLEGLAPIIREQLLSAFDRMVNELNIAVLIVEQQIHEALTHTEQAVILDHGAVVYAGQSSDLIKDEKSLDRYVGLAVHTLSKDNT
jgi:branched-chain amino acid transport system ATP-binding protein